MSYILEALKKSEQERERERGALPGIKSVHTPSSLPNENRRLWPFLLVAVIVAAGAVLTYAYVKKLGPMSGQAGLAQSSPTNVIEKPIPPEPVEKQIKQPVVATSPGAKTSIKNTAPPVEQKKQTVVFSEQQLQHDDVIGNIVEQQKQAAEQNAQPIEKGTIEKDAAVAISDIPDSIRKRIPNIAFEGHVYSSTPKRRSVMINGHKRREGDTIGDDLLIKEITPAGAEFEFQGYRFRLNALQDWSFR
jgi:general secretion pathway protein B